MQTIGNFFDYLNDFSFISVVLRLVVAMLCGAIIGYDRGKKHRPAGMRTYMLVCIGAALTIILGQYESTMFDTVWNSVVNSYGSHTDVSRFGAQVINGIGFLGAGTILVTANQQIKGITTATGLWASACMGLAIGAGFFEVAIIGCILIWFTVTELPKIEAKINSKTKNINIYVELDFAEDIGAVIERIKGKNIRIYDVEIQKGNKEGGISPSAVFSLRLPKRQYHAQITAYIAELPIVKYIKEI